MFKIEIQDGRFPNIIVRNRGTIYFEVVKKTRAWGREIHSVIDVFTDIEDPTTNNVTNEFAEQAIARFYNKLIENPLLLKIYKINVDSKWDLDYTG